ncbi:chloramphenicol acetyltransferase [Colidextribacter sp. OB.20]|uniref:CatA-like O-acetyltransferase, family 2 n=1 Tax=Colidextribacter sp. OB.20 TaxID=2304568 RepID=UPI00136D794F|nr:CatA-like O-acetyltransferase, family 2 [Colidextribacter sp. OB.20]NBI11104.1 chloramphenicol acetyltransferase [Colidextribacter sp. OB.20]
MREIDPVRTKRAEAFGLWMNAPMPMVTLFKTLDVTPLVRWSHKYHCKFNMLMCWCIGKAASQVEEFFLLPVGDKLMEYDRLAVSTVVDLGDGEISTCDIPFTPDLARFEQDYLELTGQVRETRRSHDLGDCMVIGTSALVQTELDGAVNIYAGCYNNPFLIWGRVRRRGFKSVLPVSFQFHHTQMDGAHAAAFLEGLRQQIKGLSA